MTTHDGATARAHALLAWYQRHHRQLPWRAQPGGPHTPAYAVVVSELMLQQTRVETVIDYFTRWMQRWPDWRALAAASLDDVLAQWTGLGYYNRARNLHKAAIAVVEQYGGVLPRDAESLQALPGLGPYTVGAVRSIAFGLPAPLVDGNVARVLARWLALPTDPMEGEGKKAVWAQADRELSVDGPARHDPASWNQALMELGATLCVPRNPDCLLCPVSAHCNALQLGLQAQIPPPRKKTAVHEVRAHYAVLLRADGSGVGDPLQDQVLLARRPESGRWAGLWEPPGLEGDPDGLQTWLDAQQATQMRELPDMTHILTHRRYEVQAAVWHVPDADPRPLGYTDARWLPISQALSKTSGLSRLGQRLIESLIEDAPPPPRRGRPKRAP